MKILIVGAGILGASLAFRLAQKGAEVTVLDANAPAGGASGRSFGWINASFYLDAAHHHLRVQAIAAHHRLAADLPGTGYVWQGALCWDDQGKGLEGLQAELAALGYPVQMLSQKEAASLEPALHVPGQALRMPSEGAVDAADLTRVLLAASGARLLPGVAVKSLIEREDRCVGLRTAIGPFMADHTVLAAGVAVPGLLDTIGIGVRMLPRPGLLLRTNPVDFRLSHILVTPDQEIRQIADGSLLAPCAANHQADSAESIPDRQAAIDATLTRLHDLFGPGVTEAETLTGDRPYPADGLPALGRVAEGLSIAVMHSGVTLAALAAEGLSAEISGQGADPLWVRYGPARLMQR